VRKMKYVIVGNSAAAIGAVEGIRKSDKESPITLISDEPYHTYSRPLISYYLAGKVSQEKMYYRKPEFYSQNGVEAILGVKAEKLDTAEKSVSLADGRSIEYDKLLIATGGRPFVPPGLEVNKLNTFSFIKLDDVKAIEKLAKPGSKTVIIGAGLIGLKAAEGLAKLGVDITVVELANRVLSAILDEEAAAFVQQQLEEHQVKFELNTTVEQVLGDEQVAGVALKNGKQLDCDFLIVAIGVVPNTELVQATEVRVNRGIVVDDNMATNVSGVYAAGDVSEGYDLIYKTQRVLPILPNAYQQGETAGENMAGAEKAYKGGFAMNAIGFFDYPMITAGIIKPDGNDFEILVDRDSERKSYKKIVLKNNVVVGFIYLNKVDRAGIITGLIREEADVSKFKAELLKDDFGYINMSREERAAKLLKGGRSV
jgi:NAD(P)H-nitrite reductase large subunit